MRKTRILIVDDDVGVTRTLRMYLEETERFDVRVENEGAKAVDVVRDFLPDLIFLDIVMPDVDGATVAAKIKADPEIGETPIVFLTALVSRHEVARGGSHIGGHPFLAKPVDPDIIIEYIDKYARVS